jgi:ppGpp synthetase/RelA/SpoT-type nucleotidyltranferase
MTPRTVEDRLREEYFLLSSEIGRVLHQLRTDVAYLLLPATLELRHHERIEIEARAKECDSAIDSLRRREETRRFDDTDPTRYSLTRLPDLAGVRVLAFPRSLLERVHTTLQRRFDDWTPDPVKLGTENKPLAWKYHGHCSTSQKIRAEIQVMSMLNGLFWHVEHDAFYKPRDPGLRGADRNAVIRGYINDVYNAFDELESALEQRLRDGAIPV